MYVLRPCEFPFLHVRGRYLVCSLPTPLLMLTSLHMPLHTDSPLPPVELTRMVHFLESVMQGQVQSAMHAKPNQDMFVSLCLRNHWKMRVSLGAEQSKWYYRICYYRSRSCYQQERLRFVVLSLNEHNYSG